MQVKIEDLPKSKIKIKIHLSGEEFSPYLDIASKEISKNLNIPGFRPGKAPRKLVEEKVGKDRIMEEAANIALNKIFPKISKEKNINIIGQPQAQIDFQKIRESGDFSCEVEATILPKIELPDWRKIAKETERKAIKVEDKEVKEAIFWLQKSRAKFSRKLTSALKGDQIDIDYEIRHNGLKIENGDVKNQKIIIGENRLLPEFEKNLIGLKEGDIKNFSLKCPENFWKKDLQNKLLDFTVKVNGVFKVEIPELNNDFAKSLGNFSDVKKLEDNIKNGIKIEKEESEKRRWQESVLENIAKEAEIEVPEILIEEQKNQMLENLRNTVEEQVGISFEEHLARLKKTKEELEKEILKDAETKVRIFLCLYEIAKKEKIEVKEEELNRELKQIENNYPQMIQEVKRNQGEEGFKNFIKEKILEKKVVKLIYQAGH